MTNWTIFKIIFFHFYLYSSVLSHINFLHIKNPLYNVKKTSNIEKKTVFSLFLGGCFQKNYELKRSKMGNIQKKKFYCKIRLRYIGNFLGCVLFEMPPTAHPSGQQLAYRHTHRQTHMKVNTEGTLSGFKGFFPSTYHQGSAQYLIF